MEEAQLVSDTAVNTETAGGNKPIDRRNSCFGCFGAAFLLLLSLCALAFMFLLMLDPFSKRIHIGHRVKGDIVVTLDGEPVGIEGIDCRGEGLGIPRTKREGGSAAYSIRGDRYCVYEFTCGLEGSLPDVRITYDHFNWWEESYAHIELSLFTEADGSISYKALIELETLGEDNRFSSRTLDLSGTESGGLVRIGYD